MKLPFIKKRTKLIISIVFLLCNLVTPLYLKQNSSKNSDIARIPSSSESLIIRDGESYVYENQTFMSFDFSGNITYLFKNCSFDCDDLDFGPSVKVAFQNCTIITNKFHTGLAITNNMPSNYSVEINLTQSYLTFRPAPLFDMTHHLDFVFLGTSEIRVENTSIYAPQRQLEPHENSKIIIHRSFLDLFSIQIFERARIILQNSIVQSNTTSLADFWNFTPPHNPSLFINNSRLSGAICNYGLNSTITLQNSSVDLLVKTLWVEGSVYLNGSEIIGGSSFEVADFNIDEQSFWLASQYLIIGTQNAIIQIESSVIYGLVCNESKVSISNSFITDFISGIGSKTQISAKNSVLSGKGALRKMWGVISPIYAALLLFKYSNGPATVSLINCSINGIIAVWLETIILQNCHLLLGQWNDSIVAYSNEYLIILIETNASQYLAGNTNIDILTGNAYQIAETSLYINNKVINETSITNRTMDYNSILGGNGSFIQPYLRYAYDFTTICGRVNFSVVFTTGYENYTRNFTLDCQNRLCGVNDNLSWSEIFLILSFWVLICLLFVTAIRMKISQARKQNSSPHGNSSPRDHIANP